MTITIGFQHVQTAYVRTYRKIDIPSEIADDPERVRAYIAEKYELWRGEAPTEIFAVEDESIVSDEIEVDDIETSMTTETPKIWQVKVITKRDDSAELFRRYDDAMDYAYNSLRDLFDIVQDRFGKCPETNEGLRRWLREEWAPTLSYDITHWSDEDMIERFVEHEIDMQFTYSDWVIRVETADIR